VVVEWLWRDVRQAVRALRTRPGYLWTSVVTLAVVLGASTALFATINVTLYRTVGLRESERMVRVYALPPGVTDPDQSTPLHELTVLAFRASSRTLRSMASVDIRERVLSGDGAARVVRDGAITREMFEHAVQRVTMGRAFTAVEDVGRARLVLLSHGLWQQSYGGRPDVVGRTLRLDGEPYEIIGVTPARFLPDFIEADVWTPLGIGPAITDGGTGRSNLATMARLAPGVTAAEADREIESLMKEVEARGPVRLKGWSAGVSSIREWRYGSLREPFSVLAGAMVLLVLIACVNIAVMALAQVSGRSDELGLRQALGATRRSLARMILVEVTLINLAGAALGLLVAAGVLPLLLRIDPEATRILGTPPIDWRVSVYAFAVALVTSCLAAVAPALQASAPQARAGGATSRSHGSRSRERWRAALLILQSAIALALLASGGLLVRALQASTRVDPGFRAAGVLTAQLRLSPARHATPEIRVQIVNELLQRIEATPGVTSAALGLNDFIPGNAWITAVHIEGRPTPTGEAHTVQLRRVSNGYFGTMEIASVQGRTFDERDAPGTPISMVVSRTLAERFWPGEDPIGKRVERTGRMWTVIGVVEDVNDVNLLAEPEPTIYLPWNQANTANTPMALVLRTNGDPLALATPLRAAVASVDPLLPLDRVQPLEKFLDDSIAPQRFRAALLAWLGAAGLVLGAIGIAGITAQSIGERMPELGVRLALGAHRVTLWRSAIQRQLGRVLLGALAGIVLAVLAGRVAASLLPELRGFDAPTVVVAAFVLALTAAVAAAVPAARVLRVDAARILRD
jgi:predicted permease